MRIKGDRLLVELLPQSEKGVLEFNDEGRRINEGKIIGRGDLVEDLDYSLDAEIIYVPLMAQDVRNTDPQQVIIDTKTVIAIK